MKSAFPKTISYSGELLVKMKEEKRIPESTLAELKNKAEKHFFEPQYTVTKIKTPSISGNPHDYRSIGTYWWPNPDTPDGLPYVRRDGERSPELEINIKYAAMGTKAYDLALCAYLFEDERYAKESVKTLYDWHLNPETYMTPHAEYSQYIPGICTGRCIGVIDFSMYSYRVFNAVGILEYIGQIDEDTVLGLKKWYDAFTDWMLTSENGLEEEIQPNNHGTYYDVHLLAAAIFTGRKALINKVCTTAYDRRFRAQIEPDGAQPLELARTQAMSYSISNLRAFTLLADMACGHGYKNYISFDEKYGDVAIKKAIDYLYPYYVEPDKFPYQQIHRDNSNLDKGMEYLLNWYNARIEKDCYSIKGGGSDVYFL